MKKYALFHWYQGEGNQYTFLGELTEKEYNSFNTQSYGNFVIFKCKCHIDRPLLERVYFSEKSESYVYSNGVWKTGLA